MVSELEYMCPPPPIIEFVTEYYMCRSVRCTNLHHDNQLKFKLQRLSTGIIYLFSIDELCNKLSSNIFHEIKENILVIINEFKFRCSGSKDDQ